MLFDVEALHNLAGSIQYDDDGPFMWRPFDELSVACQVERSLDRTDGRVDLEALNGELRAISNRLRDLETIAWKLDWLLAARRSGALDRWQWMFFATSDVAAFFTFARSLFDHLARSMGLVAPQRGTVSSDSFNGLMAWVHKNPAARVDRALGGDLRAVVQSATWFPAIRSIRDALVHRDAQTIVFPGTEEAPPAEIGIQLWTPKGRQLVEPALLLHDNANVASFERLAVAMLSRIYQLLDAAAVPIASLAGLTYDGLGGSVHHPAFAVLERWTNEAIEQP